MSNYEKVEEELSLTTQLYISSQISKGDEEYFTVNLEEDYNYLETETGPINTNNSEEEFSQSLIKNINRNEKNNRIKKEIKNLDKIKKMNSLSTLFTGEKRKRGRRNKDSTETGGHTSNDKDNVIRKYWTLFFNSILALANFLSKPYNLVIKPTNFAQQFGPSIIENEDFINLKLYKYFTYNTIFKDDKKHEEIGTKNSEVIKTMVLEKKDEAYIALMKSSVEYMYNLYIENKKKITINDKDIDLLNFKTINDIINERKEGKANEIKEDLEDFKKQATSLVYYIKNEGKEIKRKKEKTKIKEYIIIPELE